MNDRQNSFSNKYDLKEFIYMIAHQISRMFERGINYLENSGRYENYKIEEMIDTEQMKKVRFMVKSDIYDIVMREYGKSIQLDLRPRAVEDENCPEMVIYDVYDKRLQTIFVVTPQPDYTPELIFKGIRWRCNCMYSYKSGLPCAHEIKVAVCTDTSIFDQIYPYWFCENRNKRAEYTKHHKTRCNKEK
jgi:hypothetical protein